MEKRLHVIALNIPWPPNYGGVIDIYYKLKALHACGVRLILHCFEYDRPKAEQLLDICEEVYYYRRKTGIHRNLSLLPYNIYSRKDPELIANLLKDKNPILFEGLHSCYYLADPRLQGRMKIFRECNIEHDYYGELGKASRNPVKKAFFYLEAWRFARFQPRVANADLIVSVSMKDADYLRREFPQSRIAFVPCFHSNEQITALPGQGNFILYHAKLSVVENEKAALFLIREVFSKVQYPCLLAGMDPSPALRKAAAPFPNIRIEANPDNRRMEQLIHEAQIHLLITFQDTGLKLKLLNSLFAGRFTIANRLMVAGSGLDPLCILADSAEEMIGKCNYFMTQSLSEKEIADRRSLLFPSFSNIEQGRKLTNLIWSHSSVRDNS